MKPDGIKIIDFAPGYARETAKVWQASMKSAIGRSGIHSFDEDLEYLVSKLTKTDRVFLAIDSCDNKVAGFMAVQGMEISQLYIHPGYQRRGIGSSLITLAKQLSPAGLRLFTFEVNRGARAFYERHGFVETARGFPNEEDLPDIRYEWIGR